MEEVRKELRGELAQHRALNRSLLQDRTRKIPADCAAIEITNVPEMKRVAQILSKKSELTTAHMIALKNGLLSSPLHIKAFMEVDAALPTLFKLFSSK